MGNGVRLTGVITLAVIGVQLIGSEITAATVPLYTYPQMRLHTTAANHLTVTSASNFQSQRHNLSYLVNSAFQPPNNGGPRKSQGSGTR